MFRTGDLLEVYGERSGVSVCFRVYGLLASLFMTKILIFYYILKIQLHLLGQGSRSHYFVYEWEGAGANGVMCIGVAVFKIKSADLYFKMFNIDTFHAHFHVSWTWLGVKLG